MYEYVEDAEKIFTDGSKIDIAYMVLEYIPRAEVFYYLAGNFFNDDVCRHLFLQMLDAVEFLHNNKFSLPCMLIILHLERQIQMILSTNIFSTRILQNSGK